MSELVAERVQCRTAEEALDPIAVRRPEIWVETTVKKEHMPGCVSIFRAFKSLCMETGIGLAMMKDTEDRLDESQRVVAVGIVRPQIDRSVESLKSEVRSLDGSSDVSNERTVAVTMSAADINYLASLPDPATLDLSKLSDGEIQELEARCTLRLTQWNKWVIEDGRPTLVRPVPFRFSPEERASPRGLLSAVDQPQGSCQIEGGTPTEGLGSP